MRVGILLLTLSLLSCGQEDTAEFDAYRTEEQRIGTHFVTPSTFDAPVVTPISIPSRSNGEAIWGSIGRDDSGYIYFGVSSRGGSPRTAVLYQLDPVTGIVLEQGDVVSELRRAGFRDPLIGQNKLHSRIVQANDGYLYFSSFDEEGETDIDNPTWGGHLWRKRPEANTWEHLLATPEAVIAVGSTGRFVYSLGYWNHVLYQYDTRTDMVRSVQAGSVPGHISRNLLVDTREHVFVPSVRAGAEGKAVAMLNEYDIDLRLVQTHSLPGYVGERMGRNRGIVAFANLLGERIAFIAGRGELYLIRQTDQGAAVEHLGKFAETEDGAYTAQSLFSLDGDRLLAAAANSPSKKREWSWITYDLGSKIWKAEPLNVPNGSRTPLYGSTTRDSAGDAYVAGLYRSGAKQAAIPRMFRLSLGEDGAPQRIE